MTTRIAALSDTHFGDGDCALVGRDLVLNRPLFTELIQKMGTVRYLLLLGDILDFSVASYEQAYKAAEVFFKELAKEGCVTEAIIYVPGNHDFALWNSVEHEVNVIRRFIADNEAPRQFRWAVPGVLDDRDGNGTFAMPDVSPGPDPAKPYGGLFLDALMKPTTYVAYPNVYLVTSEGECILFTHGQYLELAWAYLGEKGPEIMSHSERTTFDNCCTTPVADCPHRVTMLREFVAMNLPMNELLSSALGMAGGLTGTIRNIQKAFRDSASSPDQLAVLKGYLDRIDDKFLDPLLRSNWFVEALTDLGLSGLKAKIVSVAKKGGDEAREEGTWWSSDDVQKRMRHYIKMCQAELLRLANLEDRNRRVELPVPSRMVFGHTHKPIPVTERPTGEIPKELPHVKVLGKDVLLSNPGAFLDSPGMSVGGRFVGAELIIYETGKGLCSVRFGGQG